MRASLVLLGSLLTCATALAASTPWTHRVPVSVMVNGHSFHSAAVESKDCTLSFRVYFGAPEKAYSDPKNKVRNYHQFRAEVSFASGQTVTSRIFGNGAPGERVYSFDEDTTAGGCWGKDRNKIVKLDVIGCRGKACDVGVFD